MDCERKYIPKTIVIKKNKTDLFTQNIFVNSKPNLKKKRKKKGAGGGGGFKKKSVTDVALSAKLFESPQI